MDIGDNKMKKIIGIIVLILISGCKEYNHTKDGVDYSLACIDQVEYIQTRNGYGDSLTPHFKPDGTLYGCDENNRELYLKLKKVYEK
jgi:hypothetical protein